MVDSTTTRRGITLIEAIVVLGIAALLTAGIWAAANTAINNQRITELVKQTTVVMTNVRKTYANRNGFTGLNETNAANSGIFPSEMVDTSTTPPTIRHVFNGIVTLRDAATPQPQATLTLNDVPRTACVNLLTKLIGGSRPADLRRMGFYNIILNGQDSLQTITNYSQANPANLASLGCSSEKNNLIIFNLLLS